GAAGGGSGWGMAKAGAALGALGGGLAPLTVPFGALLLGGFGALGGIEMGKFVGDVVCPY
ncbi:MAG TPA: hypothetical protein VHH12_03480, partial [Mycobacterium sp.]|nr:hypothetical protein [Mycobacterium sp.]